MKKVAIIVSALIAIIALPGTAVHADDPMEVDVVVVGDNTTLSVTADGYGATLFINGRNINDPVVYTFENDYNDSALKQKISELQTLLDSLGYTLTITSDGLSKVILVIQEHTSNLSDLLNLVNQNEAESVKKDNELLDNESELRQKISYLEAKLSDKMLTFQLLIDEEKIRTEDVNEQLSDVRTWGSGIIGGFLGLLVLCVVSVVILLRMRAKMKLLDS